MNYDLVLNNSNFEKNKLKTKDLTFYCLKLLRGHVLIAETLLNNEFNELNTNNIISKLKSVHISSTNT